MKTVGVIGGSTDLATAEYYKLMNATVRQHLGGLNTCKIIIHSMNVADSTNFVQNNQWDEGAQMLRKMAHGLELAGADFIICVSNTWHRMCKAWMADLHIPLLHIAHPTGSAIAKMGLQKLGLLGTGATMSSPYLAGELKARFGLDVIVPSEEEQRFVNDSIFEELAQSHFLPATRARYLEIMDGLAASGAQGVILGCTEIPLLVSQADRPHFPMFDTLKLHAEAAALTAIGLREDNFIGDS